MATLLERLRQPDVEALKNRYYELYGYGIPYHWDCFRDVEDYKAYIRKEIAKKEKELAESGK